MKKTFKNFLLELDRSDLELLHQYKKQEEKKKEYDKVANDFKSQMDLDRKQKAGVISKEGEPEKGDIISANKKKFIVNRRSTNGFHLIELGSDKNEVLLRHGFQYEVIDKTPLGKKIFKIIR